MTLSPEQFNRIVLREELVEVKQDIKELKRVFDVLDAMSKKLDNIQIESASNIAAHDRFESRITHLEKTLL